MTFLSEFNAAKQKFADAHGGNPMVDQETSTECFPDGASRKFSDVMRCYIEYVPQDAAQKLQGQRKYVTLLLAAEQHDFTEFKNECLSRTKYQGMQLINVPGVPANAKELLEAGAKRIAKLQENLAQLDREISQLPDEIARRAFEEDAIRQAQASRQQGLEIASLNY